MKRFGLGFVAGFLVCAVFAFGAVAIAASDTVRLFVDGKEIVFPEAPPQILNNRTMVPARPLAEALGGKVSWDDATRSMIVTSAGDSAPASTAMEPFAVTVDLGTEKIAGSAIINEGGQLCLLIRTVAQANAVFGTATKEDPAAYVVIGDASFAREDVFTVAGRTYIPLPLLTERLGWIAEWDEATLTLLLRQ